MSEVKQREIGGYLGLEEFNGQEYYPDLYKLNLGRTALVWLLQNIPHKRVFIPTYICKSVVESASQAGFDVVSYSLDESLHPVWEDSGIPTDEDILYLVNYYGQLSSDDIASYKNEFRNIIVDNAQAFYDRPVEGVHTLYSPRKFFGICDGAYLASDIDADTDALELDVSLHRMSYLVGRMEESAGEHYAEMLAASDSFSRETPRRMSLFTQNVLKGIDYDLVKRKRCDNYRILSKLLPGNNPFTKRMPTAPFAYPYYHEDGIALRKYLAEKKIFVPTNWTYLLELLPQDCLEYKWCANVLPLPIDQRYDEYEMNIIADAVRAF